MTSPAATATTYPFDVELAAVVPYLPTLDFRDVPVAREMSRGFIEMLPPANLTDVTYREVAIPVAGVATITVRVTTPDGRARPLPVIVDIHPGGFCLGSSAEMAGIDALLARDVGAVVVGVDYRLAPEHPYPTPLEDCYAALEWIAANAADLGVDTERIALYGQSAGGGLAAALALLTRDRGGPAVFFQYLAFPELDDRMETASMRRFDDTPLFHRPNAEASWSAYLGELTPGSDDVPVHAAPARATDLAGLPPTYIAVMQFDPLRDEGIEYARKLLEADVNVELHLFPGTFHFSRAISTAQVSQREAGEDVTVLRRALYGPPSAEAEGTTSG